MRLPVLPLIPMMGCRAFLFLLMPLLLNCKGNADKVLNDLFPPPPPVQMPPETQTGANTFGCRVNGQVWEAKNGPTSFVGNQYSPNAQYFRRELNLFAFRRAQVSGPVTAFYLTVPRVLGPGVYPLGRSTRPLGGYALLSSLPYPSVLPYITDSLHTGILTITRLDTSGVRRFVAGRFELRAGPTANSGGNVPAPTPAEVQITEGRFDVELNRP